MYDIITVGSGTVDVFVRTKGGEIRDHLSHRDICYHIGDKVLINGLDYATGGGGTNAAVSFSRMGHKTGWAGMVGQDANMHYILEVLAKERVDFLGHCEKGKSGYSVVLVGLQKDRTILTFKGINDQLHLSAATIRKMNPKWFYFSAMLGKSFDTQKAIAVHAKKKGIPYAYNPSCYLAKRGVRGLSELIKGATVLVMNAQEAAYLLKTREEELQDNVKKLSKYCKLAVITDGPRPAYATDGLRMYKLSPTRHKVVDTTGAGDAFASGVVSALIKRKNLQTALQIGYANATSVLSGIGAKNELLRWRKVLQESKNVKVRRL